jgi:hypothetical protein
MVFMASTSHLFSDYPFLLLQILFYLHMFHVVGSNGLILLIVDFVHLIQILQNQFVVP